jgi:hypothetical protein
MHLKTMNIISAEKDISVDKFNLSVQLIYIFLYIIYFVGKYIQRANFAIAHTVFVFRTELVFLLFHARQNSSYFTINLIIRGYWC